MPAPKTAHAEMKQLTPKQKDLLLLLHSSGTRIVYDTAGGTMVDFTMQHVDQRTVRALVARKLVDGIGTLLHFTGQTGKVTAEGAATVNRMRKR